MTTSRLPHSEVSKLTQNLYQRFKKDLADFAESDEKFKILYSIYASTNVPLNETKSLFVLDSSFNPPTKAHLTLARNAVLNDDGTKPVRMLFLLATENADKKPKPASFEDRLVMMSLLAGQLGDEFTDLPVDVAVIKKPFFMDKAASIEETRIYGSAQQVHLVGYDTITRIFNAKYYPKEEQLRVLEPFLSKHRLRVYYRLSEGDDEIALKQDREEQEAYIKGIGDGSRETEGMQAEWLKMIDMVDDASEVRGVSSTEARKAAVNDDRDKLEDLLGKAAADYVLENKLYGDEEAVTKDGIKPRV